MGSGCIRRKEQTKDIAIPQTEMCLHYVARDNVYRIQLNDEQENRIKIAFGVAPVQEVENKQTMGNTAFINDPEIQKKYMALVGHKLVITQKIEKVMDAFELSINAIKHFWNKFKMLDKDNSGYINLDNFFELIKENESSIVAPFLERLYKIIERTGENIENRERNNLRDDSLICFEEFLSALSTFCLFSKDQLITFVFNMLDDDRDGIVSKRDMFKQYSIVRAKRKVFPNNILRAIELYPTKRADQIDKKDFMEMVKVVHYLVFPAVRLQDSLRRTIIGRSFWRKTHKKIEDKELNAKLERKRELLRQKQQENEERRLKIKYQYYDQKAPKFLETKFERYYSRKLLKFLIHRKPGHISTTDFIGVHLPSRPWFREIREKKKVREQIREINMQNLYLDKYRETNRRKGIGVGATAQLGFEKRMGNYVYKDKFYDSFVYDTIQFYDADRTEYRMLGDHSAQAARRKSRRKSRKSLKSMKSLKFPSLPLGQLTPDITPQDSKSDSVVDILSDVKSREDFIDKEMGTTLGSKLKPKVGSIYFEREEFGDLIEDVGVRKRDNKELYGLKHKRTLSNKGDNSNILGTKRSGTSGGSSNKHKLPPLPRTKTISGGGNLLEENKSGRSNKSNKSKNNGTLSSYIYKISPPVEGSKRGSDILVEQLLTEEEDRRMNISRHIDTEEFGLPTGFRRTGDNFFPNKITRESEINTISRPSHSAGSRRIIPHTPSNLLSVAYLRTGDIKPQAITRSTSNRSLLQRKPSIDDIRLQKSDSSRILHQAGKSIFQGDGYK